MKQYVQCKDKKEVNQLLQRIENETGIVWNDGGERPTEWVPGVTSIGFCSTDSGLSCDYAKEDGKCVSADYFIQSLKIYELKKKRKESKG